MSGQPHSQWGGEHAITNHAFVDGVKKGRSLGRLIHGKNYECTHTPVPLPTHPHSHSFILFSSHLPPHPPQPSIHPSSCLFTHQSLFPLFPHLSLLPSTDFSFILFPSTHPLNLPSLHPSILLSIHLLRIYPSVHSSARLPIYLPLILSICPPILPSSWACEREGMMKTIIESEGQGSVQKPL